MKVLVCEKSIHNFRIMMYCGKEGYAIDLPPKYGSIDKYRATLGHKLNHDSNSNSKFVTFESPR